MKRKVTHKDARSGVEYAFESTRLEQILEGDPGDAFNYTITSQNGKTHIQFKNQRELVVEFLKVLALAHECVPETVTKQDGTKITFF